MEPVLRSQPTDLVVRDDTPQYHLDLGAAGLTDTTEEMAADSGYHSFSLPQGFHADDSSETSERSNAFDLLDPLNDITPRVAQATFSAGNANFVITSHQNLISPVPAAPLTTSTSSKARRPNTIHVSSKSNVSSKANIPSKVNASSATSTLNKGTASQKVNVSTKADKRAIPRPRPAILAVSADETHGRSIETLASSVYLDPALAQHFRVMVNMVKYMNHALFHSEAKYGVQQHVIIKEAKVMCEEMIYFFDGLQKSFKAQLEKIEDTKDYLPLLGDHVEEHHLEAAIKIWTEKICENVKKPRKPEERLLTTFAEFYDAQVYHPFLHTRRQTSKHTNLRELSVHLDSVYNAIEGAISLYARIVVEMEEFKQCVKGAFDNLCRLPGAWSESWGLEKIMAKVEGRISEPTTPSVASTPSVSTDAESDGVEEEGLIIVPASGTGMEKQGRAAGLKREYTL
ncbi:MAG: hypothetical protein M1830_008561 [Pleopsidium flavum]|nr:MAG: hypothetical protein M1830_008561 [Pleopsidium flavum]